MSRTPREQFLAHLKRVMKTSESSTERTAAAKLYHDMKFGLPEGTTPTESIPLPESPIVTPKRPPTEFDEMAALRDCTSLMHAVRALVAEAQAFVCWRRDMGEPSSPRWGDWQRTYSADLHLTHREKAVRLNAAIAGNGMDLRIFWDELFALKEQRYPAEVRQQARIQLGV